MTATHEIKITLEANESAAEKRIARTVKAAARTRIIWTVSQDGGKSVSGGYSGQNAERKARVESGGETRRMTEPQFRAAYPHLDIVTFSRR